MTLSENKNKKGAIFIYEKNISRGRRKTDGKGDATQTTT
jgi:hypothetical protein